MRSLLVCAAAALAVALAVPAAASTRNTPSDVLRIGGPANHDLIPGGFLGLSFEYWAARDYAGDNPRRVNPVFLQLIRNLSGGSAPVLRIGGVTTDSTWWPVERAPRPVGIVFDLNRRWTRTIGALAAKLDARLILGINLEADSPKDAGAEARALLAAVGRRHVAAFELGNEPELYSAFTWGLSTVTGRPNSWDFAAFDRDYAHIAGALPNLPLAGPVTGQPSWFAETKRFLADQPRVAVVTLHRYPLQQCFLAPSSIKYPSVANLLAPANSRGLADSVAAAVSAAHGRHVVLRVDEMNTVSCGSAPAVAESFATALWSLDALFEMARVGVDGVNIHTYPEISTQLFHFTRVHGRWRGAVEPEYYGLDMFAQAAPAESRLLRVSPAPTGQLHTWATRAPDGTIRVVLINEGTTAGTIALRLPGAAAAPGTLERLTAPSITATGGVTLAGQEFGPQGVLVGQPRIDRVASRHGRYSIRVPAASAAMLTVS